MAVTRTSVGILALVCALSCSSGGERPASTAVPDGDQDGAVDPDGSPVEAGQSEDGTLRQDAHGDAGPGRDANVLRDAASFDPASSLCDGSDELRLAVRTRPGGVNVIGFHVLIQPGLPFLYIDGNCHLYVSDDPWQPLRAKALTSAELAELTRALRVDAWPAMAGDWCLGTVDDYGWDELWADGWMIFRRNYSADCRNGFPVEYLQAAVGIVQAYAGQGTVLEGPVRYTLVPSTTRDIDNRFRAAEPWPDGDPTALTPGQTYLAEGGLAAELRELRHRFLAGEVGDQTTGFIPVVQPDGEHFELRLRDVLPFENEQGALVLPP